MTDAVRKPAAPISRRAALTRAAGGAALAAGLLARCAASAGARATDVGALEAELAVAEAAWHRALEVLARAERRWLALRPTPPASILVPDPEGGVPAVPVRWPALRKHLRRRHAGAPDLAAHLAAARHAWHAYQRALVHAATPAWLAEAEAAEACAAAQVEALHRRLASTPAQSWPGVRLKLPVLWRRLGPAREGRDDDDLDAALLHSALADATRASVRSRV